MIGLDTNVLVRYIVQDDAAQASRASELIETQCSEATPGFVSQLVLAKLYWVLQRGYRYPKNVLLEVITHLLSASELEIERSEDVWLAMRAYSAGAVDLADGLVGRRAVAAGCSTTFTFDRKAGRSDWHTLL